MAKIKILIVEDDETATEILQEYIYHHNFDVEIEWCWNGYEALVKAGEFKPHLIFLDYMMPKFDGMEFVQTLRALDPKRNSYIVVVSAFVDDEKEIEFIKGGVDRVIPKPISIENVASLLKKVSRKIKD